MEETGPTSEEASLSQLTVELMQQAAALAGERLSAPIREAASDAARLMLVAGGAVASFLLAAAFLGVGIGLVIARAPETARWWICLATAGLFTATGLALAYCAAGGRRSETAVNEAQDDESRGSKRPD